MPVTNDLEPWFPFPRGTTSGTISIQNTLTVSLLNLSSLTIGLISGINVSAGTESSNVSSLIFSNSNGVSFGLSAGTITGSVVPGGGTIVVAGGTQTNTLSSLSFAPGGGISFGLDNSTITASAPQQSINFSAGTTSFNRSNIVFSNSNNVSFGISGSTITASIVTAAAGGSVNISGGTTSNDLTNLVFSNSNNVSFGLNGSTITASATVASTAGVAISAAAHSESAGLIVFSNSNNVSFGMAGSTITAQATVASTQGSINVSAGTTNNIASNFVFSNFGNVSFGLNGSTITAFATVASTQGSINLSAGTTSNIASAFVLSNSNNISFGISGSTITASLGVGTAAYQDEETVMASADGTSASAVWVDIPGLVIAALSGETYVIDIYALGECSSTSGAPVIALTGPAFTLFAAQWIGVQASGNIFNNSIIAYDSVNAVPVNVAAANQEYLLKYTAVVRTSAAGVLQARCSRGGTTGTVTIHQNGTYMKVTKVS